MTQIIESNALARQGRDSESIKWGFAEHLKFTLGVDRYTATSHDRYQALAYTIRDRIINQWIKTQQTHYANDVKRVYYLSLEYLVGRAMSNNIINLKLLDEVKKAMDELNIDFEALLEEEVDPGLGNGGLGRLAACFMDSLATLNIPAVGYGIRYDYGIFRQEIHNGYQVEQPDEWLTKRNPWEIERPEISVKVHFGGTVETITRGGTTEFVWQPANHIKGIAYDMPIVGYGGNTINTLRLWSAKSTDEFDFNEFNEGDYVEAVREKVMAENLTKVLYPNDLFYLGKELRFKQQYFFVACSLADIVRRFKKSNKLWKEFPKAAAIQLNDTHPALAVPELMRILLDEEKLSWQLAWKIVKSTLGYTNHTLMPEALEKWPIHMFEKLLPRHLQIIYEINHRFLQEVAIKFPKDNNIISRMSLIQEGQEQQVRMAYLSIVGSHSTNGVAALHTELLKTKLVPDFAALYPTRFNNKTNGITQRRWLLKSNPLLAQLITKTIGSDWITNMDELQKLKSFATDKKFQNAFLETKKIAKEQFASYLHDNFGWSVNPSTIFDFQVKRIHEYKRQLLNALHIVILYDKIKSGKGKNIQPRTFMIGGKAAPGYRMAKLIIKFIGNISSVINNDPDMKGKLAVYFLPNYCVSLAEKIFPAADVSEQISTAGTEASGTSNMKFMCNGALTIGTLDGANIEIAQEAGMENIFVFGHSTSEVNQLKAHYNPTKIYNSDPDIKAAIDLIKSGHFNYGEPNIFDPLIDTILSPHDQYQHLGDLRSYIDTQQKISDLYGKPDKWAQMAILNIASSGKFSSDRTIGEYAKEIWDVEQIAIKSTINPIEVLQEAKKSNN